MPDDAEDKQFLDKEYLFTRNVRRDFEIYTRSTNERYLSTNQESKMTDKQENLFSMFTVLHGFLTQNSAVVSQVPAFQRSYEKLGTLIEDIRDVDSGRKTITAGKSDIKTKARDDLAAAVYEAASALFIYADENDLPDISDRTDYPETYYKRMRDTAMLSEAADIVKLTEGKETELADYGLTAEEIAAIGTKKDALNNAIVAMGTSTGTSVNATKSVYELIGEAKDLIDKQIDRHAVRFRSSKPEFYNMYLTASRVIDAGVRHDKEDTAPGQTA
jgi:hypothetical protein